MNSNGLKHAYALLGLAFLIVFGGAYLVFEEAGAPTARDDVLATTNDSEPTMALQLTSPEFSDGDLIPAQYTCDAENINPPLQIAGVPEGTKSLVLVMDDPDIPEEIKAERGIEKFDHWALYNIPADTLEIASGIPIGTPAQNSRGETGYVGPCPPPEYEPTTHRYIFRLYALSGQLNFIKEPTLDEVETAATGMMLEKAELMGRYTRVTE